MKETAPWLHYECQKLCIENRPYPMPHYKLAWMMRHKIGRHAPEWELPLFFMLDITDAESKKLPIIVWRWLPLEIERSCWRCISKTKIGLYNNNHTLFTNDVNVECIACSVEKRGENIASNQIWEKNSHPNKWRGEDMLVHQKEASEWHSQTSEHIGTS